MWVVWSNSTLVKFWVRLQGPMNGIMYDMKVFKVKLMMHVNTWFTWGHWFKEPRICSIVSHSLKNNKCTFQLHFSYTYIILITCYVHSCNFTIQCDIELKFHWKFHSINWGVSWWLISRCQILVQITTIKVSIASTVDLKLNFHSVVITCIVLLKERWRCMHVSLVNQILFFHRALIDWRL